MRLSSFQITRFQFARDRIIGDSQIRVDDASLAAVELFDDQGRSGLGFMQNLHRVLPALEELNRVFEKLMNRSSEIKTAIVP